MLRIGSWDNRERNAIIGLRCHARWRPWLVAARSGRNNGFKSKPLSHVISENVQNI